MNAFKLVKNRKIQQKINDAQDNILLQRENNINEINLLGRIDDNSSADKSIKKIYKLAEIPRPSNKSPVNKKISANQKVNTNSKIKSDQDLNKLWDVLHVKKEYIFKFQQKISAFSFSEHLVRNIIDMEKLNLEQTYAAHVKINNYINQKNNTIESLKNLEQNLNKSISSAQEDKIINDIKDRLESLKYIYINLFNCVNSYKEKLYREDKYGYWKVEHKFLENNFVNNCLTELNFLKEGFIGVLFRIRNPYEIFLIDFKNFNLGNENNSKTMISNKKRTLLSSKETILKNNQMSKDISSIYYFILNEMIREGRSSKHDDLTSSLKRDASEKQIIGNKIEGVEKVKNEISKTASKYKLAVNETEKDAIVCVDKSMEEEKNSEAVLHKSEIKIQKEQIICNQNNITSIPLEFYKGSLISFKDTYQKYYSAVSEKEKITLNVKENYEKLIEGINPKIIVEYSSSDKTEINSLCVIGTAIEEINSLEILNISDKSSEQENLKSTLDKYMEFIQNNFNYKTLYINIFYGQEDGKHKLNKEINQIFVNKKFRWRKLQNLDGGICFQRMAYQNENYSEEKFKEEHLNTAPFLIESNLTVLCSDDNKNIQSTSTDGLNYFLKDISEKTNSNKKEDLIKIKQNLPELLYYDSPDNNIINLIEFFNKNKVGGIENKVREYSSMNLVKILSTNFSYIPALNNMIYTQIENKNYLRIESGFDILIEKDLNQRMFMMMTNDSNYALIFCEMNEKFKEKIAKEKNIYKIFNELYSNLNPSDDKIKAIFIPEINYNQNAESSTLGESEIQKVNSVFWNNTLKCNFKGDIIVKPKDDDIILKGDIFFALVNPPILEDYKLPAVFCGIFNN
ncbi:MAG: hypothetical protein MJ252_02970 [archaeon]|nr:hypothetical protein [archaeon]